MAKQTIVSLVFLFVLALSSDGVVAQEQEVPAAIRDSVVKVTTTYRSPDLHQPWTRHPAAEITGTGVIIAGNRILTNAHVAEHATRIQIQPSNSTRRYTAELEAISSGIDLAIVRLRSESEAEEFFADRPPLRFREEIPHSGDTVEVYGFPIGGQQLSITSGVVSRIDYSMYYNLVSGLVIQIDAAVNPGNSGGPVVHDGQMIGIVYSQMSQAENIGFIIPTEEINAFLAEVANGEPRYRPNVLLREQHLESQQLREYLGLDASVTGVYVRNPNNLLTFGGLQEGDVITHIAGHDIDNTGSIRVREDLRLNYRYLVPHIVDEDEMATFRIWRAGDTLEVKVPTYRKLPFSLPFLGANIPPYFIYGPLCFMPAYASFHNENNAFVLGVRQSPIARNSYQVEEFPGQGFVTVLTPMFTHAITEGYEPLDLPTLKAVNGVEIKNLTHLVETLRELDDEWVVFDWYDVQQEQLVFRRAEIEAATEEILEDNGIRRQMSPQFEEIWNR